MTILGLIIDIGGVLASAGLVETVDQWALRLGMDRSSLLASIYGGNDDTVLVGRVSEDAWWRTVSERVAADTSELRRDLEAAQKWDPVLVEVLRGVRSTARTAILSNAWPSRRRGLTDAGLGDLVEHVLLSSEIGVAKPSAEAFQVALDRLGTAPSETLFVDDTPGHVEVASGLGLKGHLHTDSKTTADVIRGFCQAPDTGMMDAREV